jgi:hypothetical protein
MEKIRIKFKKYFSSFTNYFLVSASMYVFVMLSLYLFINLFNFQPVLVYAYTYFFAYLLDYQINLRIVFKTSHNNKKFISYMFYLVVFYLFNNLLFYLLTQRLDINHFQATVFIILFLFPLRFFVQSKIFNFKS